MRIAIMGSGAIGGYVGARLAASGEDVAFIARGAHLEAMQREGLRLESVLGDVHLPAVRATAHPAEIGPVDVVLFTVKLYATEDAAAALCPLVAPHTRVITLQNGIDSVDLISRHVPREQVVAGVISISASVAQPGTIRHPGGLGGITIDGSRLTPVLRDFTEACRRAAGVEIAISDTIQTVIWRKFITLCAASGATSLMRAPIGPILADPDAACFLRQLLDEGVAIAQAMAAGVESDFAEKTLALFGTLSPQVRTSMSEDLEHGRRLELDWLSGRMHGLGQMRGIPTPAHSAVYRALALYRIGGSR